MRNSRDFIRRETTTHPDYHCIGTKIIRLFARRRQTQMTSSLQVLIFNRDDLEPNHVFLVFCFVLFCAGIYGDLTAWPKSP